MFWSDEMWSKLSSADSQKITVCTLTRLNFRLVAKYTARVMKNSAREALGKLHQQLQGMRGALNQKTRI